MPKSAAVWAAYLAAAIDLLAGFALLLVLRNGVPAGGGTAEERYAFITGHVAIWRLGWLVCNVAGVATLAFLAALATRFWAAGPLRCGLALACAAAGLAVAVSSQSLFLSAGAGVSERVYSELEPLASLLVGYAAAGLYTLAGFLILWAGARRLPRGLLILGLAVWLAGAALSVSSLTASTQVQAWSAVAFLTLFVVWATLSGRWLGMPAPTTG
jgi:hypothetical protein